MGWFDRRSDEDRQARRAFRAGQRGQSLDEANRLRAEQDRFEQERNRRRIEEEERLRQYDLRDGRFDGRPN